MVSDPILLEEIDIWMFRKIEDTSQIVVE
jgi:hypothetical protein